MLRNVQPFDFPCRIREKSCKCPYGKNYKCNGNTQIAEYFEPAFIKIYVNH